MDLLLKGIDKKLEGRYNGEMLKECRICKKKFEVEILKSKHSLYCDNCRFKKCFICNNLFLIKPKANRKRKFCSKECYTKAQIGRKIPPEIVKKTAKGNRGRKTGKFIDCLYCGEKIYKYPKDLKSIKRFCSYKCYKKYSQKNVAPKRNNKGKEKEWARKIYKRDNFACQKCYKTGKKLNAHHIKSWAEYPKKRFKIYNGITLCKECHISTHRKKLICRI